MEEEKANIENADFNTDGIDEDDRRVSDIYNLYETWWIIKTV